MPSADMLKNLLDDFVEKEQLVSEELKVITEQIGELEARLERCRVRLGTIGSDRVRVMEIKQRYAGGPFYQRQVGGAFEGAPAKPSLPPIATPTPAAVVGQAVSMAVAAAMNKDINTDWMPEPIHPEAAPHAPLKPVAPPEPPRAVALPEPSQHSGSADPSQHFGSAEPSQHFASADPSQHFASAHPSQHFASADPSQHLASADPSQHLASTSGPTSPEPQRWDAAIWDGEPAHSSVGHTHEASLGQASQSDAESRPLTHAEHELEAEPPLAVRNTLGGINAILSNRREAPIGALVASQEPTMPLPYSSLPVSPEDEEQPQQAAASTGGLSQVVEMENSSEEEESDTVKSINAALRTLFR